MVSSRAPEPFLAQYHGPCGECDDDVAGSLCTYKPGTDILVHVECPEPAQPRPTCQRCWMEIAPSGACGCDE